MNHNNSNLKIADIVILDKGYRNSSSVVIKAFTPNYMFATIHSIDNPKETWDVMTNRLSVNE